jgi:hypothetical protein
LLRRKLQDEAKEVGLLHMRASKVHNVTTWIAGSILDWVYLAARHKV